MRHLAAALLALTFVLGGCGPECRVSAECPEHHRCDIDTQRCIEGCRRDAECGPNARCEPRFGVCRLLDRPEPSMDAGTSTTADAGP